MIRFRKHLIGGAGVLFLALAGTMMSPHSANGNNQNVTSVDVVGPNPLPVGGTVAATQSGPWSVGQSGVWNVGQSGVWNVGVANTSANPVPTVDTERAARIPYQSAVSNATCSGNGNACFFYFAAPPSGYRLVAENLSGYFQISPAATVPVVGYLEDITASFNFMASFTAPLGQLDLGGHIQAAFNQPTRFYFDRTENSLVGVVSANWSNGNNELVLTGYLENCSITGCPAIQR